MGRRRSPGETVVRRFVTGGRVWTAIPSRVVADGAAGLAVAHWPGVTCRMPASYAAAAATGAARLRFRLVDELASGRWRMVDLVWARTTMLTVMLPGEWFSTSLLFGGSDQRVLCWYVNFEEPFRRTPLGADTNDLMLDLVLDADGTRRWKDADEYRHARRVGLVSARQARAVEGARERATAMLDKRSGPLAAGWESWRRDGGWPLPRLPDGWEVVAPEAPGCPATGQGRRP